MMRSLGEWAGEGLHGRGWAERQARARSGKVSLARIELKCCYSGNKEPQIFEEGCHTTQRVCQHEGTGKRKGPALRLLQNHPDNS